MRICNDFRSNAISAKKTKSSENNEQKHPSKHAGNEAKQMKIGKICRLAKSRIKWQNKRIQYKRLHMPKNTVLVKIIINYFRVRILN